MKSSWRLKCHSLYLEQLPINKNKDETQVFGGAEMAKSRKKSHFLAQPPLPPQPRRVGGPALPMRSTEDLQRLCRELWLTPWPALPVRSTDLQRLCRELWLNPWPASDPQTKIPQGSEDIELHRKGQMLAPNQNSFWPRPPFPLTVIFTLGWKNALKYFRFPRIYHQDSI